MRKVFAFITLLCTVCLNVQCQKAEVHLADGSTFEIPVDEIDSITFSMTNPFNFETKTVKLNSGYEMPIIGIGTYLLSTAQAEESVYHALKVGMRLIDTADIYGNEVGVRLAEGLRVRNLIIYHTEDRTLDTRRERYTAEARTSFSGGIWVPDDLERIVL